MRRKLTTTDWILRQTEVPYKEPIPSQPTTFDESQEQLTQPYKEAPKPPADPYAIPWEPPPSTRGLSTFDKLEATLTREYRPPLPSQGELFDE